MYDQANALLQSLRVHVHQLQRQELLQGERHDCASDANSIIIYVESGSLLCTCHGGQEQLDQGQAIVGASASEMCLEVREDAQFIICYADVMLLGDQSLWQLCQQRKINTVSRINDVSSLHACLKAILVMSDDVVGDDVLGLFSFQAQSFALATIIIKETLSDENGVFKMQAWSRLKPVLETIDQDPFKHWSRAALAAMIELSSSRFADLFKQTVGISPQEYIKRKRMETAKCALLSDPSPIQKIAKALGFYDQFHFSRQFKEVIGVSPSAIRKQVQIPA